MIKRIDLQIFCLPKAVVEKVYSGGAAAPKKNKFSLRKNRFDGAGMKRMSFQRSTKNCAQIKVFGLCYAKISTR